MVPETRLPEQLVACAPDGLRKTKSVKPTPERLSVACIVTVTLAEVVVVLTDIGLNVKLVKTGGCVSEASAGSAAMTARNSTNRVLAKFRAEFQFPHADMRLPPAVH